MPPAIRVASGWCMHDRDVSRMRAPALTAFVTVLTMLLMLLSGCVDLAYPTECGLHPERCCDLHPEHPACLGVDASTADTSFDAPLEASGDVDATDDSRDIPTDVTLQADSTISSTDAGDSGYADASIDHPVDSSVPTDESGSDADADVSPDGRDVSVDGNAVTDIATDSTDDSGDSGDSGVIEPPSCTGALACGSDSCCATLLLAGGTFQRSFDWDNYTDPQYVATISDFRLDKYEITVGRFRKFVNAVVAGWSPPLGSGKHTHLSGGKGLVVGSGPSYESGWNGSWTALSLPTSKSAWEGGSYLACDANYQTWTPITGSNENKPINCITWYQAYAFCIWDGGFLPSEAEWNYAAANGVDQDVYPWGSMNPGADTSLAIYGCYFNGTGTCSGAQNIATVGSAPSGNGRKWHHADLAGNVAEWTFDLHSTYPLPCDNCASTSGLNRVVRGGTFNLGASYLRNGDRQYIEPSNRALTVGARCARSS